MRSRKSRALAKPDIVEPFVAFRREMYRMFDDFAWGHAPAWSGAGADAVDIQENAREVVISAERPGISEHNIDVSLGDALTIKGEKRSEREATDGDATYRERHFGWFLGRCGCPSTPATNALTPQRPVRVAKPAHLQRAVRSSAARTV